MEKDKDGWYDVQLQSAGVSPFTGNIYPEDVMQVALVKLRNRPGDLLEGEYGTPRLDRLSTEDAGRRVGQIHHDRTSHQIDLTTLEIKDGAIMAKIRPSGALGHLLKQQLQSSPSTQPTFGMRAFVQYAPTLDASDTRLVSACDIVTFDLVNKT